MKVPVTGPKGYSASLEVRVLMDGMFFRLGAYAGPAFGLFHFLR